MMMASFTQMRQSNGCESRSNDEIFKLHLEASAGPCAVSPTSCKIQEEQSAKKK